MLTKEQEFKQRLVAVIKDLNAAGRKDPEAMWLLGSLAASMADKINVASWSQFKDKLTREGYDGVLEALQRQGNDQAKQGKVKQAYAIQALAISTIAKTQTDPEVKQGEILLDRAINTAIAFFKKEQAVSRKAN